MKLGALLDVLQELMSMKPADITRESDVLLNIGVLKGKVRKQLEDPLHSSVVCFCDDAEGVGADPDDDADDGEGVAQSPWTVTIHGGVDLEVPPIL